MNKRLSQLCAYPKRNSLIAIGLLVLSCPTLVAQEQATSSSDERRNPDESNGMQCVFLGHSFFAPIAREFASHPEALGLTEHEQFVVFHGGANGSPGRLWASDREDVARAKALIEGGEIDLVGLTYFPEVGSEVGDYRRWIDLGLANNPDTQFFIMAPWPRYRGRSLEEYEEQWMNFHEILHGIIDELCEAYPDTEIFCIPQGKWMVELWKMFETDQLPEIDTLMRPSRDSNSAALFRDELGHGGELPVRAGTLLWLAFIYDIDVRDYEWDTRVEANVKELIWRIKTEHLQGDSHTQEVDQE